MRLGFLLFIWDCTIHLVVDSQIGTRDLPSPKQTHFHCGSSCLQGPGTVADHTPSAWDGSQAMWQHDAEVLAWNARLPGLRADLAADSDMCMAKPWGVPASTPPVLSSSSQLNISGQEDFQPGQAAEVIPDSQACSCSAGHSMPEAAHQMDFAAGPHSMVSNTSLAATLLPVVPAFSGYATPTGCRLPFKSLRHAPHQQQHPFPCMTAVPSYARPILQCAGLLSKH